MFTNTSLVGLIILICLLCFCNTNTNTVSCFQVLLGVVFASTLRGCDRVASTTAPAATAATPTAPAF